MSIASYLFTGSADEASRNDGLAGGPPDRRAEFYRVTDIALKSLYAILAGVPCPKFKPVAMSDDYTQLTFEFPGPFVDRLASIEDLRVEAIIARWRDSEDVPYDNDTDLRDLLAALVRLARLANSNQQGLYLWNAL